MTYWAARPRKLAVTWLICLCTMHRLSSLTLTVPAVMDVITHECGHAFQGYLGAQDPIREHADIGMRLQGIHSMSMEFSRKSG